MLSNTLYGKIVYANWAFPFPNSTENSFMERSKVMTHLQNNFLIYNGALYATPLPTMRIKYYKMRQNTRAKQKTKREQEKRQGKTFLRFDIWSMAFYVAHQRTNGCSTRIINFFPCAHYNTVALRRATNATTTIFMMFMRWCALIAIRSKKKPFKTRLNNKC